jgi:hypothetical protein
MMARLDFTIAYPDGYPKGKYTIKPIGPTYPEDTIVDVEYTVVDDRDNDPNNNYKLQAQAKPKDPDA